MRIFVAVWPPSDVVATLRALPRPLSPGVRWTAEPTWHVTLRFLGEIDDAGLSLLAARLAPITCAAEAIAGPSTVLLNRSVLAVPVRGLDALAADVVDATADIGDAPEPRRFRGHITLARGRGRERLPAGLAGGPVSAAWPVTGIAVVRSVLGAGGPTYETLARFG